jgi:serine protease Do
VRNLSNEEREQLNISAPGGVIVEKVGPGPALDAGLRPGDVILQLNSQEIASATELSKIVENLKPDSSTPVLVQRQGGPLFMAIKIPPEE